MITSEVKSTIRKKMLERRETFGGTDRGYSTSLGINEAQYSQIKAGKTFQVLSEAKWVSIARQLEINLNGEENWKSVETPTYKRIMDQLKKCQEKSISGIFCDDADIGKTQAGKDYAKNNKYVAYIDCSQVKAKPDFVREIAKEFGVGHVGRYRDVYRDLCYYLKNVARNPLVILDEAGDLDRPARLELKALWNATEGACGWYQMGADALKVIIENGIKNKIVGYAETFSRYGSRFQRSTPLDAVEKKKFITQQAILIIKANAPDGADVQKILHKTGGSLRRIRTELSKL